MPYAVEKFNRKRALQRKLERDKDFDHNVPSRRLKQVSQEYASAKKGHTSSRSDADTLTTFPFTWCYAESQQADEAQHKTRRRLERHVRSGVSPWWVRPLSPRLTRLGNQKSKDDEVKVAVTFSWLEGNDTNSTLLTRRDCPCSFDGMFGGD